MTSKQDGHESDAERFGKNLAALLAVRKAEIQEIEKSRPKKRSAKGKKKGDTVVPEGD